MVRDVSFMVSSWFVMVRHGSLSCSILSWFTNGFVMVRQMFHCHGFVSSSWFIMVRHGSSWFIMVRQLSWFVMVCHGSLSWFTVMVRHGSLSWFCHGLSWFVMCYSLKFSRRRSCDPLFSQSGSQIHYQISFFETSYFPLSI